MIQINKDVQDVNSSIKSKEKKLSSIDRVFNFDTQKFMTLCKKEESIKKNIDKLSRMSTSGSGRYLLITLIASEIPSKSLNKMPKQKQKVVDKITALIKILQAEVKKKATQSMSQLEKKNEKNMTKNNRFNSDASSDSESSERRRDSFSKGFKEETKEMHGSATYLHQDTISANKKSTSFNSDCSANESEEEYQKDQMCREISDPTKTVFEELRRLKKCIKKKGDMQPGSQPDKSAEAEELFRILTEKLEEVHHKDPLQNELASKLLWMIDQLEMCHCSISQAHKQPLDESEDEHGYPEKEMINGLCHESVESFVPITVDFSDIFSSLWDLDAIHRLFQQKKLQSNEIAKKIKAKETQRKWAKLQQSFRDEFFNNTKEAAEANHISLYVHPFS